jgi:DNA-binding XRE family transcriptional regulator
MAGHKNFNELRSRMSPERRERNRAATEEMLAELPLAELRQALQMTQETLAELLETSQPEISKIEHRTDVYVSTLRRYIEAMGGELQIIARFPEGKVSINQFRDLAKSA